MAEKDLRDADRRKAEFLATLAHELRNPLAPIRAGVEVMKLSPHDSTLVAETLATMERQLLHWVALVDDLFDVSRISRGKFKLRQKHVPMCSVLQQAIEMRQPQTRQAGFDHHVVKPVEPKTLKDLLSNPLRNTMPAEL